MIPIKVFSDRRIRCRISNRAGAHGIMSPRSFHVLAGRTNRPRCRHMRLFAANSRHPNLVGFPFRKLASKSGCKATINVVVFVLIVNNTFNVIVHAKAVSGNVLTLVHRAHKGRVLFVPTLFVLFSLNNTMFNVKRRTITFTVVVTPLVIQLNCSDVAAILIACVTARVNFTDS